MAFKRSFKSKKRSTKRYTRPSIKSYVNKALQKNIETKKHSQGNIEIDVNSISSPSALTVRQPLQLASGAGLNQRIGHAIRGVGLDIRGQAWLNTNGNSSVLKMVVYRMKNMRGVPVNDILETDTGDVAPASLGLVKIWTRFNTDDYEILSTRTLKLGNDNSGTRAKMFKAWIPLKNKLIRYDGAGNNPPAYNDIQIMFYSAECDGDETLGTNVEVTYNSTFYYKDG